MANKSIYCEEIEEKIADWVALGLPRKDIAQALGITENRLKLWIHRKKLLKLKIADKRLTEAKRRLAGVGDQWWLSKVMPDQFGDNQQNQGHGLTVQVLIDARSALDAAGGLDECEVIEVESDQLLIECKSADK